MTRLNVVLMLVLLASAIYLVRLSYDSRRLFSELDRAQAEAHQLENEYERLKTERQAQATPLRVEKAAREKLAMRTASPAVTQYVDPPVASASAAAAVGVTASGMVASAARVRP